MDFCMQITKKGLLNEAENGFQKNFACSPLSISLFLTMVGSGVREENLGQSLRVLGVDNVEDLHAKASELMEVASSGEDSSEALKGEPVISFINGVWMDKRFAMKPFYREILKDIYRTEVKVRDIRNLYDSVENEVNLWTEENTKGLIRDLVSGYFDQSVKTFLMNAIYFKGSWKYEFDSSRTKQSSFHLINGESVKVPFMRHSYERFCHQSFDTFQLLSLPYKIGRDERRFSMYFFLPNAIDGLEKLINHFGSNPSFLNQKFNLWGEEVRELMIPKFEISCCFVVSEIMGELGMNLPSRDIIDLIEKDDVLCDDDDLPASIYHVACVKVNEEGTEAAAVTCDLLGCCLNDPPPVDFIADHPFMFMIREDNSSIPFFVGAVVNPSSTTK